MFEAVVAATERKINDVKAERSAESLLIIEYSV